MCVFEIIFFRFIVCPVVTESINKLIKTDEVYDNELNPIRFMTVLNKREYELINNYNLNNFFIIIILILFLTSLLFYFYVKIRTMKIVSNHLIIYSTDDKSVSDNEKKQNYIKHGIVCAVIIVVFLMLFQVLFYYCGLEFKYIESKDELLVLFIESIKNNQKNNLA